MVAVPTRDPPLLTAAFTVTAPGPVPAPVPPMLSHDALLVEVQLQPAVVCTVTEVLSAAAAMDWADG